MRQTVSGLIAAVAFVMAGAAPAMACGWGAFEGACSPCGQAYVSPCAPAYVPNYSYHGCYSDCSVHERLPDPVQQYHHVQRYGTPQYYYVNQGPTFTGPGNFAPFPVYRENAVSGWDVYRRPIYRRHVLRRLY
jgi:hypothetical protein